jgi:hypothetical protein
VQASHRCLARQRGEGVQQRLRTGCLGIPVPDHNEQARIGEPPREVHEQPERRRISPLHVVEHEQQAGFSAKSGGVILCRPVPSVFTTNTAPVSVPGSLFLRNTMLLPPGE